MAPSGDPLDALLLSGGSGGGREPSFDDDADIDLSRLSAADRDAIMQRVTPDDSAPPDAFALSQNEIRREMIDRGIQPKGFYNDDAARLQEEFNREHAAEKESRMHQKVQMAARAYLKETVHRRKMEREKELNEEVAELAKDPALEVWLGLVKRHETPRHAALGVSVVGTRALCKSLVFNHSLQALTLSRNGLDDAAGKSLALMLTRNATLQRLDLEANAFGPATCRELAGALTQNQALEYLSLESNPLTDDEKDFSGVSAIANMMAKNTTLRTLNLWRTRLGAEGGKLIAQGVERNDGVLLCVDVGNNRVASADGARIDVQLRKNRAKYEKREDAHVALRKAQLAAAAKEKARQDELQRQKEHAVWIEERKEERQQERAVQELERQRLQQLEEDKQRQIAARKAAEFQAKLEMEKNKKKKKGGGKKKKK